MTKGAESAGIYASMVAAITATTIQLLLIGTEGIYGRSRKNAIA
jgi:hypothetical protein